MKIDALYEYVVFAKHLNFSTAAKELYLSQPGLSIHIGNLEKELGFTLVDRENGPILTPAGLVFLNYAQDILDTYRTGLEESKAIADAPPFVRILSTHDNPDTFSLVANVTDIPFTFVTLDPETPVLRALQKNTLDIGFCTDFSLNEALRKEAEEHNITCFPLGRFPGSFAMMKSHSLAHKDSLTREDLVNASIVINGGTYYDSWKSAVQKEISEDIPLKFRLDPIGSITNLSHTDFGDSIHICGGNANKTYLSHRDDVVIVDKLDGEPLMFTTVIAYRTDNTNENVALFIERLQDQLDT